MVGISWQQNSAKGAVNFLNIALGPVTLIAHTTIAIAMSAAGATGWRETIDKSSNRPYFYQQGTQQTSWVKPDELLTPAQLATGWAETSDGNGRRYWYNKEDRNTTAWQPPSGWSDGVLAKAEEPP